MRVLKSTQFMLLMAELIKIEHTSDMDVDFRMPQINQFAGRIVKDAQAIQYHLKSNTKLNLKVSDNDFVEEYTCELYRVFHFFIGLPIGQIKEVMDNLHAIAVEEISVTDDSIVMP